MTDPSTEPATAASSSEALAGLLAALETFNRDGRDGLKALEPLYASSVRFQDPIQTTHGWDEFEHMMKRLLKMGDDLRFDVHHSAATGDQVFLTWTMVMKHRQTKLRLAIDGVTHCQLEDGKVVNHRDYWDLLGSLMGSVPALAPGYRALIAKLG